MNESILERIQSSAKALKIDLYTAELASLKCYNKVVTEVANKI